MEKWWNQNEDTKKIHNAFGDEQQGYGTNCEGGVTFINHNTIKNQLCTCHNVKVCDLGAFWWLIWKWPKVGLEFSWMSLCSIQMRASIIFFIFHKNVDLQYSLIHEK